MNKLENHLGFTDKLSEIKSTAWNEMGHEEGFAYMTVLNTVKWNFSMHIETFFQLHSPDDMTPFQETVEPMLPEYYLVEFADNYFYEIQNALNVIERASEVSLYVMVGATVLIISLLLIIFLRHRMTEIGLFLSIGEKRINIALQFILEMILITGTAFFFAFVTGKLIFRLFSQNIILNQLISLQELEQNSSRRLTLFEIFGFYSEGGLVSTFFSNFDATIPSGMIVSFGFVSIGIILLITTITSGYILHLTQKNVDALDENTYIDSSMIDLYRYGLMKLIGRVVTYSVLLGISHKIQIFNNRIFLQTIQL